jgi:hypothetical protein
MFFSNPQWKLKEEAAAVVAKDCLELRHDVHSA